MKKLIKILLVMALIVPAVYVKASAEPIGLSAGVDYMSNYLWRGMYFYNNDGAIFPTVSFEKMGITLSYVGEFSEDAFIDDKKSGAKDSTALHATDFGLDYSYSFGKTATLGVGVWYYYFHNEKTNSFITGTVSLSLDSVPLTPTLTYNHDYYTDKDAAVEQSKDFYIQLGISHDIELVKDASLGIGLVGSYYRVKSFNADKKGISDITLSFSLSVVKDSVTLTGGFNYVMVPGADFKEGMTTGEDDIHRFYSTFGASYSL